MPAVAPYLRIRQVQSLVVFRRLSLTPQRFAGSGSSKFQIIDASGGFKPDCNSLGHRQDTSDGREDVASQGSQKPSSEDVDVNSAVLATELLDDYVKPRNDAQSTRRTSGDISRKYAIGEAERSHYGSPHPNLGSSSGRKRVYQLEDLVKDGLPFNKAAHAAPGTRMRYRRVALSGGSSGIGYAIAKRFIEEGAESVAILSRSAVKLESAIQRLQEETGLPDAPVWGVKTDLENQSSRDFWDSLKNSIPGRQLTVFNTLINCAGQTQAKLLLQMSPSEVIGLLSVNLTAPIALTKEFMLHWHRRTLSKNPKESGPADLMSMCVVNVSSLLAVKGSVGTSVYGAAKAGQIAFAKSVTLEAQRLFEKYGESKLHSRFRINTVLPGYIDTPMVQELPKDFRDSLPAEIPLGRMGTVEEVADAVLFLVTNEYANNCVLNLDGGLSAT